MQDQKLIMAVLIIVLVDIILTIPIMVLAILNNDVDMVFLSSELNVSLINTASYVTYDVSK